MARHGADIWSPNRQSPARCLAMVSEKGNDMEHTPFEKMAREELVAEITMLCAEIDRLTAAGRSEAGTAAALHHGSGWSEAQELFVDGIEQPAALIRTKGQLRLSSSEVRAPRQLLARLRAIDLRLIGMSETESDETEPGCTFDRSPHDPNG